MTWSEILYRSGGNHLIEVWRLCPGARQRLDAIGETDIDAVMSLRLSGKERVFGIMDGHIMKVLSWDPTTSCARRT
jgi:hypothetical protein